MSSDPKLYLDNPDSQPPLWSVTGSIIAAAIFEQVTLDRGDCASTERTYIYALDISL